MFSDFGDSYRVSKTLFYGFDNPGGNARISWDIDPDIDGSLDLEKFSKRNDSDFSLSLASS